MKPEQSQPQQKQHSPASPAADGHSRSTKQPQVIAIVQTKPALLETGANVLSTAVPAAISAVAPATQAIGNAAQAVQQSANQISQTVQQTRYDYDFAMIHIFILHHHSLPVKLLCAAIAGISGTSIIYPMGKPSHVYHNII